MDSIFDRFDDSARDVMIQAESAAESVNHGYIGTEHILLGLIQGFGAAVDNLKALGVDLGDIRLQVEHLILEGPDIRIAGGLPFTPRAKMAIEYALEEARALNRKSVGSEHILLGLLRDSSSVACSVLTTLGLEIEDVRERVK